MESYSPFLKARLYCSFPIPAVESPSVPRSGVVWRLPPSDPAARGSIHGGVKSHNLYPGNECLSFVCVLSSIVSGVDLDILPTTESLCSYRVFCFIVWLLLQVSNPMSIWVLISRACKSYIGVKVNTI